MDSGKESREVADTFRVDDSKSADIFGGGQIFIGRQPILDRGERVVAYELLYRDSATSSRAIFNDSRIAATRIMADTFATLGADAILGPYTGYVNVDRETLLGGLVLSLPRDRVTIEILEDIEADEEVQAACRKLRREGFKIALDDWVYRDPREPLLEYAHTVKVDLAAVDDRELPLVVRRLKRRPVQILAEKVETREQFECCHKLGFDLFQGFYFARPTVITGRRLDPAREALVGLLDLIRQDVDTEELCDSIKVHPDIGVNVLRLVNSAVMTRATRIGTVRDAVQFIGRGHLQRWFNVLLYAGDDKAGLSSPLLQTAAKRGRLMELLARQSLRTDGAIKEDTAFLVGMASMLDALLNRPREEIVRELRLDDEIRVALLRHEGGLGALLHIAELLDAGDFSAVSELVSECGITVQQTARAELEAFHWVQELSMNSVGDRSG